ncbi:MAG: ParB/RepB/Spo0J family partition protein [Streptococcaceae bacterium]|jgi:ParB family chromosome partitioning protein|nr:ParB/RepB/Spo0J family partition protein [Streptococcaceae bacterium]
MSEIVMLSIEEIRRNPKQPRVDFDTKELESLAQSIRKFGVIQPIIVKPSSVFGYEIVAGERRFRASQLAGKTRIPAIIRSYDVAEVETIALLENIQREDLNPIEEAVAYQNILANQQLTHEKLAQRVGKSRAYLTNMLRLLSLPKEVQMSLKTGELSNAQARTLLALKTKAQQLDLAKQAIEQGLTVRQLEAIVRLKQAGKSTKLREENIFLAEVEEDLKKHFGTTVVIKGSDTKGKIELSYADLEELNRILALLKPPKEE